MTQEMDLKDLERKAWTAYFDDGILDITAGLFILLFGIGMTTMYTYLAALSWMAIFLFAAAKKAITVPRVGLVKFSPERERRIKKETLFYVVFFTITAGIGLVFFMAQAFGLPSSLRTIIGELALVTYVLIIAAGLGFVGYWKQIPRFYVYCVLTLVVVLAGLFIDIPEANPLASIGYQFLVTGTVILLSGLVVLARFLRKHPTPEGDEYVAR
jgi:hypothetical protein